MSVARTLLLELSACGFELRPIPDTETSSGIRLRLRRSAYSPTPSAAEWGLAWGLLAEHAEDLRYLFVLAADDPDLRAIVEEGRRVGSVAL